MKCLNCRRKLPNKDFKLNNKCIWCSASFHQKKKNLSELDKEKIKKRLENLGLI